MVVPELNTTGETAFVSSLKFLWELRWPPRPSRAGGHSSVTHLLMLALNQGLLLGRPGNNFSANSIACAQSTSLSRLSDS